MTCAVTLVKRAGLFIDRRFCLGSCGFDKENDKYQGNNETDDDPQQKG